MTDPERARDAGFQAWHLFLLLSMAAATVAVVLARNTHPVALLLLSAAVLAAGLVAIALHRALGGFLAPDGTRGAEVSGRARAVLEKEKALALHAIKELEFDKAMGKVSEKDYADLGAGLRARAMSLMQDLDRAAEATRAAQRAPKSASKGTVGARCVKCATANDPDAKFCKECGGSMRQSVNG
jgi:hypothetical protein